MPNYSLIQATPRVPDGISCKYQLVDPSQAERRTLLVVAFEGEYPDGSRGNAHGAYIATAALHGLHAFDADGVVLDFRGLTYRWGNTLLKVFSDIGQFKDTELEPGEPRFPVVVVTSDKCRSAFLSLVTPTGQSAPDWHFDDINEAIEFGFGWIDRWLAF